MTSHVILTRFNIPTLGRESVIRASDSWLENRFELFEKFCFPSVSSQSNKNFSWFIYFDQETPQPYYERALEFARKMPQLTLRFGTMADFTLERIQDDVRSKCTESDWVVTTRLDNDDALPRNFVERIRNHVRPGQREVLNFTNGYIWKEGTIYDMTHRSNAFASLSEPVDGLKTIFVAPHMQLGSIAPIQQIGGDAGWMQVIHGQNVSNRVRGSRAKTYNIRKDFDLSQDLIIKTNSSIDIALDKFLLENMRDVRDLAISIAKKILRRRVQP